jgi:Fic family protein
LLEEPLHEGHAPDTNALMSSFNAHYKLVAIQPFRDGNESTARILTNYIQAINNLPMGPVFNDTKADYLAALNNYRKFDDEGYYVEKIEDYWPFITLMARQYIRFLEEQISQVRKQ